jgi:hypothetical protein
MSILFTGSYQNETEPLWSRAGQGGGAVGPDLQVSTLTTNSAGFIALQATGHIGSMTSAPVVFDRTNDVVDPKPSLIIMTPNIPLGGGAPTENISITDNIGTFYDPLAVGELLIYGQTNSVLNPVGAIGFIKQVGATTDIEIATTGLHTSSFFVSSINNASYPPSGLGPNIEISTMNVNDTGFIRFNAAGTSTIFSGSSLFFDKSSDIPQAFSQAIKMESNNLGNILPVETVENISVTHEDIVKSPPGIYYDTLALGNLLVYGVNNPKVSTIGQVALFQEWNTTTTDVECVTTGFHTDNLIVSTINGQVPNGGGGSGPDLVISTINVNESGFIRFNAAGTSNAFLGGALFFQKSPDIPQAFSQAIKMAPNNLGNILPVQTVENISITHVDIVKSPPGIYYDTLALGNLLVYGVNNPKVSTIGQVALFQQWSTTTDVECVTTGFHTSSITASTIQLKSAYISSLYVSSIVDYIATVSTINAQTVYTSTVNAPIFNASTISFQPNAGGVKVDLGLGEFAGSFAGQFAGEVTTMTIAGAALVTGVVGLSLPRTQNNIYPPGEPSTFQAINTQTQLQFSTIGSQVSSFTRFVSSTDGSMGTITPGFEYIISSIIAPGTQCIRSFSDPINLANASTFTSTVQSFGYWIPVPKNISASTISGNFNATSTLTAYNINASTTITALGAITGNTFSSAGIIQAGNTIITAGNMVATGQGQFTGGVISGGSITAPSLLVSGNATVSATLQANIVNANQLSTTQITALSAIMSNVYAPQLTGISSINGLPYVPGGGSGGTLGVFSTLIVSSLTTTSSLTATGAITAGSLLVNGNATMASTFTNSISSFNITAQNISGTAGSFGSPTPTQITNTGIFNPIGQITYGQGLISSIRTNNLSTSVATIPALTVSTVNGLIYPPPFNSTIQGNFYVTSTLVARDVFATSSITSQGPIGASGNITGFLGAFTGVNSSGPITAPNAVIDGVIIGPAGVLSASLITGSNLNISSINGADYPPNTAFSTVSGNFNVRSTMTAYRVNVSTSVNCSQVNTTGSIVCATGVTANAVIATNQIITPGLTVNNTAFIPVITGLTTVNGVPYPPALVSSFQQLFTSSFQTSTINCAALATVSTLSAGNILCSGNVSAPTGNLTINGINASANFNGLSATLGGVNIGLPAGAVTGSSVSFNSANFLSTNVSSFYVSSINNAPYPPTLATVSSFSTIFVSSLATVGSLASLGSITAPGAVIGAVTLSGGQVSAALVTGTQVNTNSMIVQTNGVGNSIVAVTGISYWSTMVVNGAIGAGGDNVVNFQNGAICGTSNVGFALDIVSSCTIGGNLTLNGVVTGNLNVNGTINTPQNINVSTGTFGYVDIEAAGVFLGNSTNTLLAQLSPDLITLVGAPGGANAPIAIIQSDGIVIVGVNGTERSSLTPNTLSTIMINTSSITTNTINISSFTASTITTPFLFSPTINPELNTGNPYLTGNGSNTNVVPSYTIPGYPGQAAMTYTKIQSGSYRWGLGFTFENGLQYRVPNLELDANYPVVLKFAVQSYGNVGGSATQIYGVWNIYVGYTDAVLGVLQPTAQQDTIFAHNCSIVFTINSASGFYFINVVSNVGGPAFVDNQYCSWTVQPVLPQ